MASERITRDQAVAPFFVGVDVGGTNIKIGIVDDRGNTLAHTAIPTDEALGAEAAMQRSHDAIASLLSELALTLEDVAAVGLGSPGSMDIPKGLILEPPNMPSWRYFPLRDTLSKLCGKPVGFANDANAAAYGEYWIGSGRQFNSMVMFTLGTGVGGGIILDGVSLDGSHSFGSELGHIIVDSRLDARLCVWGGGQGQLEAYASAPGVVARTADLLAAGRESTLTARVAEGELTSFMIYEEAERGDELSLEVIVETARLLGIGIVTVVHAVDPEAIILGGAMDFGGHATATGRMFLDRVREEFQARAYHVVRDTVTIDYATLGGDAGYIGAAGIGRSLYQRSGS
ncbi:MAG: ROK family protein [Planctomycetaceae bacterium]|nr:ROK family protein [Planctomycetales bacterium]MCB9873731.1 ROK family protein [Planctomycetaceae bacterium]MCB9938134.1 ROK family protein [Planctomycetaceae bacterium]